ncbi:MAG: hypothetical protein ACRC62_08890 [Microcoleus sp.]
MARLTLPARSRRGRANYPYLLLLAGALTKRGRGFWLHGATNCNKILSDRFEGISLKPQT